MNKADLINDVAKKADLNKTQAGAAVNAVLDALTENLGSGDNVSIIGFGTFQVQERQARKGRNPQTGEEMDIPARKLVKFKPGKNLRDKVAG